MCSLLCGCRGACKQPRPGVGVAGMGCTASVPEGGGRLEDVHLPDIIEDVGESEDEEEIDVEADSTGGIPDWAGIELESNGSDAGSWDLDVLGGDGDEGGDACEVLNDAFC